MDHDRPQIGQMNQMTHSSTSSATRSISTSSPQSEINSIIESALHTVQHPASIPLKGNNTVIANLPNLNAPNPFGKSNGILLIPNGIPNGSNPFGYSNDNPMSNPMNHFPPALSPQPDPMASNEALKLKLQRLNAQSDPPSDHTIGTTSTFADVHHGDDTSVDSRIARHEMLPIPLLEVHGDGARNSTISLLPNPTFSDSKNIKNGNAQNTEIPEIHEIVGNDIGNQIGNHSVQSVQSTEPSNTSTPNSPRDSSRDSHRTNHSNKTRCKSTWENSHSFVADCHICNIQVEDYEEYCNHLKNEHYDVRDDLDWLTCDVCGKMNAHKSNFISHLASHTGNKPFKCRIKLRSGEFCATEASTRQNLQTHILKVHKMSVKHKLSQPPRHTRDTVKVETKRKKKKKKKVQC